ncbi:MAG: hypothetical protein Q7J16_10780 [Candidatus Cloacimonadales bacterium]|nr:hypothetical protein [Candidatus Cloacimonadales bacterium]
MNKNEPKIFKALFIELKLYDDICLERNIERNELSQYYDCFIEKDVVLINEIRRIRQLYNNKKRGGSF